MLVFGGVSICEISFWGAIPLVWMTYIPIESMYIYIYLHWVDFYGKCKWMACHTWIRWDIYPEVFQ